MEPVVMTADELREYVSDLPDHVILRVTVQEDCDGGQDAEEL